MGFIGRREGRRAGEKHVEEAPDGEHVGGEAVRVVAPRVRHLGGDVIGGAAQRKVLLVGHQPRCKAKVGNLERPVRREKQVRQFEVPAEREKRKERKNNEKTSSRCRRYP